VGAAVDEEDRGGQPGLPSQEGNLFPLGSSGEAGVEGRAGAHRALGPDAAAVALHDALDRGRVGNAAPIADGRKAS